MVNRRAKKAKGRFVTTAVKSEFDQSYIICSL